MTRIGVLGGLAVAAAIGMMNQRRPMVYSGDDDAPIEFEPDFPRLLELDYPPRRPRRVPDYIPNDHGPVIDTTPESKRARRRRLARSGA